MRLDDVALPVNGKVSNMGRCYIVAPWANESYHKEIFLRLIDVHGIRPVSRMRKARPTVGA